MFDLLVPLSWPVIYITVIIARPCMGSEDGMLSLLSVAVSR